MATKRDVMTAVKKMTFRKQRARLWQKLKQECQKSSSLKNVWAERRQRLVEPGLLPLLLKQRFSTIPERGKPQRAEPALENRINESNMHDVYEPGHQGERERICCGLCADSLDQWKWVTAAVHKETGRKPRGSTEILFSVSSGNKSSRLITWKHLNNILFFTCQPGLMKTAAQEGDPPPKHLETCLKIPLKLVYSPNHRFTAV